MSLPDVTPIVSYDGNGSTATAYPFLFKVLDASHVKLYLDGVLSSDAITVTGVGDDAGVEVTTSVAYSSEVKVTLLREVPFSQETDLVEGGRLREESLENALDFGVMQAQQLKEELGRTIQVAPGSTGSILPSATNSTIGQDENGDLVSRTAEEELAHLGVGEAATEAAASAAAAATSETNAATSETNSGTSETNAAASAAAAEASNVNASTALGDLSSKSFPVYRVGKSLFAADITSDLTINFPGGGSLTLKASERPYAEDNATNANDPGGANVSDYISDIINIINGDVRDYDTSEDSGLSGWTASGNAITTVSNATPITGWSAKLAVDGGADIPGVMDLTYYGSDDTPLTVPFPLEIRANTDSSPPSIPYVSYHAAQTLTEAQKERARENIGVVASDTAAIAGIVEPFPPQSRPSQAGRTYTDTVGRQPYASVGSASVSDWLPLVTPYAFNNSVAAGYVADVEATGALVTRAEKSALDTFFEAASGETFYSKLKRFSFPWFANKSANSICALSGEVGTFHGTTTHKRGAVVGDASTGYFAWPETMDNLSITGINCSAGVVAQSTNTLNSSRCFVGSQVGSKRFAIIADSSSLYFTSAIGASSVISEGKPNLRGVFVGSCTGVSSRTFTRRLGGVNTSISNTAAISDQVYAQEAFFMARNTAGVADLHSGAEFSCFFLGTGLSQSESEDLAELIDECEASAHPDPATNSIVILDDDIHENVYSNLFPMMQTYNIPMTFALVSSWVGDDGTISADPRCTESELQEIYDAGGSFANHTDTHPALANESVSSIRTELETCNTYLDSQGWNEGVVVYPFSSTDQDVFAVAAENQNYGVGGVATTSSRYENRLYATRLAVGYNQVDTLAQIKGYIDSAIANNNPLVLMTHCGLAGHSDSDLEELIAYAQAAGGKFRTIEQALNIHGANSIH